MTEKINREAKKRHAAEIAAYEARKFELFPGRDKLKEKENNQLESRFLALNEGKFNIVSEDIIFFI